MLGRGRKIAHLPWSGQVTHAVAGQLERVVRPHFELGDVGLFWSMYKAGPSGVTIRRT